MGLTVALGLGAACEGDDAPGTASAVVAPAPSGAADPKEPAEAPLPDAKSVFEAHVEAIGGRAKVEAVKGLHIESTLEMAARGISGRSEMWWQGGRFLVVDTLEQLGVNRAGYDGERVWTQDAFNSLRDLEGKEAELYRRGSSPFLVADHERHFERIETLGRREVEGRSWIDVRAVSPLGQEMILSFDEDSHLLVESAFDEVSPALEAAGSGARRVVTRAEDYREVKGLRLAHRQVTQSALGQVVQRVEKIELDPEIDARRFAHPQGDDVVDVDPAKQPVPDLP